MILTIIILSESTMNDKPKIIQSLWIGKRLSIMEQLCVSSFLKNGHPFHLYIYDDVKNVPRGTVIKDASKILSPEKIFKYRDRDTYAGFSNLFRYKLLLEKGNFWVDTDMVCIKPFKSKSLYTFARGKREKLFGTLNETLPVESCVIKAPAGSKIINYCYEASKNRHPEELEFAETGPFLLAAAIKKFNFEKYLSRENTFCPIYYKQWDRVLSGSPLITLIEQAKMILFRSRAVHLWNEMWRVNGVNKNASFPKRSIYEQLKRRYLDTK